MPCSSVASAAALSSALQFEADQGDACADVFRFEIDGRGRLLTRALQVALLLQHAGEDEMRHRILRIEGDGLLQLSLGVRRLGRVSSLDQREGGVEVGTVGIDRERFLDLRESLGTIALREGNAGEQRDRVGIVGLLASTALACSLARGILLGSEQERAEIELGLDVVRVERNGTLELLIASGEGAELDVCLGEIVVRGGIVLINLDGVGVLNDGLLLLALRSIVLATLQILRLLDVGIPFASLQKTCTDQYDQQR